MSRFLILLIAFNLLVLPAVQAQITPNAKTEKARLEATKLAADSKSKAEIKMNTGQKLKGRITAVEQDSFSFIEQDSSKTQTIAFSDVDKINKHRKISTGGWIGIGAAAAVGVIVTAFLVQRICNERAC